MINNTNVKSGDVIDDLLIGWARSIDNVDMYLGPFSEMMRFSSSSFLNEAATYFDVFQYAILKVPFVSLYLAKTRDFSALLDWVPQELFAISIPGGSFIQIMRTYERVTNEHYKKKP